MGVLKKYKGSDALVTVTLQIKAYQTQFINEISDRETKAGRPISIAELHRKALDSFINGYLDSNGKI